MLPQEDEEWDVGTTWMDLRLTGDLGCSGYSRLQTHPSSTLHSCPRGGFGLHPLTCCLVGTLRRLFHGPGFPTAPSAFTGSSVASFTGVFLRPLRRRFTHSLRGLRLSSGRPPSTASFKELAASCIPLQCLSQALTPPWVCVLKLESSQIPSQNPVLSGSGSLIGPSVGSWLRSGSLVASHTGLYPSWPLGLSQSCLWLSPTALLLLCTDPRWGLAQRNPGTPPTMHYDDTRGSVVVEVPGGLCGKPVSRQTLPAMHQRLRC